MAFAFTRRAALLALGAGLASPLRAEVGPRFACTELILTETALALGLAPAAIGNKGLYRRLVGEPPPPESAADLGPLDSPNMELLVWLKPDLILAAEWQKAVLGRMERVAKVHWLPTIALEAPPLRNAEALMRRVGEALGREAQAEAFLNCLAAETAAAAARIRASAPQPLRIAKILEDGRHAMIFTSGSLVGDMAAALGLENAEPPAPWGVRMAGLDALTGGGPALVLGKPGESAVLRALRRAGLRLTEIEAVFPAGGAASALRLARALARGAEAAS